MPDMTQLFNEMASKFDPKKVEGIDAVVQFDLSGENGGQYWLRISDGKLDSGEGQGENPKVTLKATADDWTAVTNGTLNPMQAFMSGKIKIQGDMGLALKLQPLLLS
jgi:putative sterol carrier protein